MKRRKKHDGKPQKNKTAAVHKISLTRLPCGGFDDGTLALPLRVQINVGPILFLVIRIYIQQLPFKHTTHTNFKSHTHTEGHLKSSLLPRSGRFFFFFYLYDVRDEVGQSLVHFDFLCVFLDLVFHGLQLMSDTQNLTLHDLKSYTL